MGTFRLKQSVWVEMEMALEAVGERSSWIIGSSFHAEMVLSY